ncbi:MAG TPA: hypothetical protein VM118_02855, partial [Acidobacteriota bacterium]|nr:hypothetical protein [Acidobacteriota bacterium]
MYLVLSYGTGHLEGQQLLAWDYRNRRVQGQWDISAGLPGTRLRIDSYTMLPGETRLYGVGDTDVGSFVFCYDLVD